jgi:phosphohistidine phosphatase
MDLLIVRHAIAFERNPKRWPNDGERPLSPDGMLRARKAAAGLKRITERPVRLLTSPLLRAKQTAAILTEFAGWPKAVECAELSPGQSPEGLLEVLRGSQDKRIAVVGHQPGLGRLLAACLPGGVRPEAFELKKMGVAFLSFAATPRAGHAVLHWLLPPRVLRSIS